MAKKVKVTEACQGCTLCTMTCPSVFAMNADNLAEAIVAEIPEGEEAAVEEAAANCPAGAIEIE